MTEAGANDDAGTVVTDPGQIGYLLARLRAHRSLLTVRTAHSLQEFSSVLLDLDGAGRTMSIDQLYPVEGHPLVHENEPLWVHTKIDDVEADWGAMVMRIESLAGGCVYRMAWPAALSYQQRRSAFRVAVPRALALPPAVFEGHAGRAYGRIVDVSASGVGAVVSLGADLNLGERLPCVLPLPNQNLPVEIEIRYRQKNQGRLRFGAALVQMSEADQRALHDLITQLQREWIQQQAPSALSGE